MNANQRPHSLLLVGFVLVSLVAGVAAAGVVGAQEGGLNNTSTTSTAGPATTAGGTTSVVGETTTEGDATATNGTMGSANGSASVVAEPDAAGATANHTVTITVGPESTGNLTGVAVNYTGSNASVSPAVAAVESVTLAGESVLNNTTQIASDNTLNFTFDLSGDTATLEEGDELSMVYQQVGNPPEAGSYPITVTINPGGESTSLTTSLDITESQATTSAGGVMATTEAGTTTSGADETTSADTTAGEAPAGTEGTSGGAATDGGGGETTSGNGPGFSVVLAVVGVLAAALVALGRR